MSEPHPGAKVDLTNMKSQEHRRLLGYIDDKIIYWRAELRQRMASAGEGWGSILSTEKAISYVDAYQTARVDLFGESLPDE